MREPPPPQLTALLDRLNLASAGRLRRMRRRAGRLARDLPRFESVWVDALAQLRLLTPYQAAEINAGRGAELGIGPFVLCGSLRWPNYTKSYRARRLDGSDQARLVLIDAPGPDGDKILRRLEALAKVSRELSSEHLAPVVEVGLQRDRIWAAAAWTDGRTAAEWMVHNGRFPPEVVLEIARSMLAGLTELEQAGLCHGDLSAAGLALSEKSGGVLLLPGLRAVLRPEEGYAHANLLPEAYDYLAPERISRGTPPDVASDVYACGCLWWHLLCGRPPLAGGNSLAKLRAAQAGKVVDVRRLAPDVPPPLAAAISGCLDREPGRRPESMARLASMLGPPTRGGRVALARCLTRRRQPEARWSAPPRTVRASVGSSLWVAVAAGCLIASAAILWPLWRARTSAPETLRDGGSDKVAGPAWNDPVRPADEVEASPPANVRTPSEAAGENPVTAALYETDRPPVDVPLPAPPPPEPAATPKDLVLPADGPLKIQSLMLRAGQRVLGPPGKRPSVTVPRTGLPVDVENVRFENIDFVCDHPHGSEAPGDSPSAVVDLRAARAEFRGCSFRSAGTTASLPAAIRWSHPDRSSRSALSLPSSRLRLSDCVLRGIDAGVDCRKAGALAIELANSLHLGTGPLVRIDHCPRLDEPVLLALSQVTLRGSGPLLECRCTSLEEQPGEITIRSAGCAFVPAGKTSLLLFSGPTSPDRLLENVRWTGQGSLVSPEAPIAGWRVPDGRTEVLDDASVSIAGLVRSEVGFAGDAASGPAASEMVRWQAPLRSTDPPGIDASRLPEAVDHHSSTFDKPQP